jgi:hypothetical protein
MDIAIRWLRNLNYVFGIAVLLLGLGGFFLRDSIVALLLAIALFVVGPLEDLLNIILRQKGTDPAQTKELVNQGTSLTFVLILLAVILISVNG